MRAELIQDLIISVPVCSTKDPLTAVVDQLSSTGEDWLLIWDDRPIGALPVASLSRLMASMAHQLLQLSRATGESHHGAGQDMPLGNHADDNPSKRSEAQKISRFQFLQTSVEMLLQQPEIRQRLRPLQLIPVSWSMDNLQAHLNRYHSTIDDFQWVVVDSHQRPLGLLKLADIGGEDADANRGAEADSTSNGRANTGDANTSSASVKSTISSSDSIEQLTAPANDATPPESVVTLASKELNAQNVDLLQSCQLKNDYLAYISHEIKNPITALLGLSELLADSQARGLQDGHRSSSGEMPLEAGTAQRHQRYVQLIRHNSLRLADIASDVLDLSRIELGHLQLSPQMVPIAKICGRAWHEVWHQLPHPPASASDASEVSQSPQVTTQPGLTYVMADEQRLLQMLTQLLNNAHTSTASFGQIGIAVEAWGQWCAITIWDTGVGVPSEHQPRLLQTLQALENPRTHALEGTGLGIVLTQRLAERHGGDLTFLSAPGKSEFTLLLPMAGTHGSYADAPYADAPYADALAHAREQPQTKGVAVVAETTVSAFTMLSHVLKANGYGVVSARSGTEALKKVRRLNPDVVILNPSLPFLSGWDVLALLKADAQTRHIPIILSLASPSSPLNKGQADAVLSPASPPATVAKTLATVVNLKRSTARSLSPLSSNSRKPVASSPAAAPLSLTVLYFNPANPAAGDRPAVDFNDLLHPYGCRVLEVDDPEQGDLVTQVWKPDVVLLGLCVPPDVAYLKQLNQLSDLAMLPMVAIDPAIAAAGHQAGLAIYPCLISTHALETGSTADMSLLVQVIRVAAQAL